MVVVPMSEAAFAGLAERGKEHGIELQGRREGVLEKMGVKARWAYDGENLTVDVLDKPFFLSKQIVEDKLRSGLAAAMKS